MPRARTERILVLLAPLLAAAPAAAATGQGTPPPAAPAPGDSLLAEVYRREVFVYDPRGRSDPFRPLLNPADLGIRLEQLELRGVIYNPDPRRSVAVFSQGDTARSIRLRVGQRFGNLTVLRIEPRRVDVRVDEFGTSRVVAVPIAQRPIPLGTSADAAAAGAPPGQPGAAPAAEATPAPSRPMPLQRRGAMRRQEQAAPSSPQPTPRTDARP